jgi:raffinose/stachyose/melibiose transport system substrate-binding protein
MGKKWSYSMLSVILTFTVALVGCSGNVSNSGGTKGSTAPAETSSKPAAPKNVTLKAMGLTPQHAENIKAIVSDYEAANPGVKVDFQIPPDKGSTLLKTRFASGDAPDIFYLGSSEIPAWADKLADLSNEPWMAHALKPSLGPMTIDGKKLGFPMQVEGHGFVYNKDLFAKAGITQVPTTLSELKQTTDKLKAAGIQSFGEAWSNWGFLMHLLGIPFSYEKDQAGMIDQINKGTKQIKDLPNINNFFTVLDLTNDYGLGKQSVGYDFNQQQKDFADGKMAMIKQGTWYTNPLMKLNPKLNIGMFPVPLSDNAEQTKMQVAATAYFVLHKDSANLEESKKFLVWLHKNGQKYLVEKMNLAPVFDDLKATNLGSLFDDMNSYVASGKTYDNYGTNLWPTGFNTDIAKPLQAYIAGVANKEETLKQLQELWTQHLKK